jgi:GH15 family glucan-1,4-alpha-glucosidase
MLSYRDHAGLPLPSWDLWEERRGVHLFTVCATIGALQAASNFASDMGAMDRAAEFGEGAERMRGAMLRHMWDPERRLFARMALPQEDGSYRLDFTLDASAYALFAFGALEPNDPRVTSHMQAIRERLWVKTDIGGIARYERDPYHQVERHALHEVPGNPWVICTLWYAQWLIAKATNESELREALEYLEWTNWRASASGVLAEQYHPYSGAQISVSPLTWSHATLMTTVNQYRQKHAALTGRGNAGLEDLTDEPARHRLRG